MELYLRNRDELYIIDLENLIYFKADDHYTHVYYITEAQILLPFSLSKIESQLSCVSYIIRAGRRYLINTKYIYRINSVKQEICFFNCKGETRTIKLSKDAVKSVMGCLCQSSVNGILNEGDDDI